MTAHYLVDLTLDEEDWMIADRAKAVRWGPTDDSQGSRGEGGVATQPTMKLPTFTDRACDGTPIYSIKDAGCFMSECLAGDDETLGNCLKECEPGYTNLGHMCSKWSKTYGRRSYGYNYVIPWSDAGLSRRRSGQAEWSLP